MLEEQRNLPPFPIRKKKNTISNHFGLMLCTSIIVLRK